MEIKRIKTEVEFSAIKTFDYFDFEGKMYIKLPQLACTMKEYVSPYRTKDANGTFNAIEINNFELAYYEYFKSTTMVRPLKTELKIYD